MELRIVENTYNGLGDAITFCWLVHSAHVSGQTDVRLRINRWHDIAAMLELRYAFDPLDAMNPCKQLPTGASCADIKHARGAAKALAAGAWI